MFFISSSFDGSIDNVSVQEVLEDDYNTDTTYIVPLNMSVKFKAGDTIIGEEFLEKGIRIPVENVQDDTGATVGDEAAIASYIDSLT